MLDRQLRSASVVVPGRGAYVRYAPSESAADMPGRSPIRTTTIAAPIAWATSSPRATRACSARITGATLQLRVQECRRRPYQRRRVLVHRPAGQAVGHHEHQVPVAAGQVRAVDVVEAAPQVGTLEVGQPVAGGAAYPYRRFARQAGRDDLRFEGRVHRVPGGGMRGLQLQTVAGGEGGARAAEADPGLRVPP